MRASADQTRMTPIFFFFFFFFFSFSICNIFLFPFITTLKIHISYKISSVSPNCYFSPTVSIRIVISKMMFSCYFVNACDFKFT